MAGQDWPCSNSVTPYIASLTTFSNPIQWQWQRGSADLTIVHHFFYVYKDAFGKIKALETNVDFLAKIQESP